MVLQEGEDFLRWKERILKSVLKAFMEGSGFPSLQLVELKNAESSESSLDFNSKFRRKSRTHLLEVCFNSRRRLPEVMPMARLQGSSQYGFKWSYASVVVEKGPRKEVGRAIARFLGLKGMVSVSPFFFFKGLCFVDSVGRAHCLQKLGIVPMKEEIDHQSFKLVDLSKIKMKTELKAKVVLPVHICERWDMELYNLNFSHQGGKRRALLQEGRCSTT
ncbi:hypothetical protein CK203_085953 [Vitis vinifera]|uniref:Uncharacterized protein n=1 Tax=Vitis vinifera TaxID=29760 RepID=A0A438DVL3_VITVI|nr:hypothetical protein CK203_085953 [Vitis vinifera]